MKLYLVTADGCDGYGVNLYAVGIFDSKDRAQEVYDRIEIEPEKNNLPPYKCELVELELNVEYPLRRNKPDSTCDISFVNDNFLGGYVE